MMLANPRVNLVLGVLAWLALAAMCGLPFVSSAPNRLVAGEGVVLLALWPTLAVLAVLALLGGLLRDRPLQESVMQLVFVGLAALTLPHMVLLERARQVGRAAQR